MCCPGKYASRRMWHVGFASIFLWSTTAAAIILSSSRQAFPLSPRVASLQPFVEGLLASVSKIGRDGDGNTRHGYSVEETDGMNVVAAAALAEGLSTDWDRAGNLVVTVPQFGEQTMYPYIALGSHMDTVKQGGRFDGVAGVVCGLAVLTAVRRGALTTLRPLRLLVLRAEESSDIAKACKGSAALVGKLTPRDLALTSASSGEVLKDMLARVGADVTAIKAGRPLMNFSSISAYLELHIEQGDLLADAQLPVGVVSGIRGLRRLSFVFRGQAGHAGVVPRQQRRDAVVAAASAVVAWNREWQARDLQGIDLVLTTGLFNTDLTTAAFSRIPDIVRVGVEFRSASMSVVAEFDARLRHVAEKEAAAHGCSVEVRLLAESGAAEMDTDWRARLLSAAREAHIPHMNITSGAGHDAAVFANAGIASAMLFVRSYNGSHHPGERCEVRDMLAGTQVLLEAVIDASADVCDQRTLP